MRTINIFIEDFAQEEIIKSILIRLSKENNVKISIKTFGKGGFGNVETALKKFLDEFNKGIVNYADLLIIVRDANCKGINFRQKELEDMIKKYNPKSEIIFAIPDPHVERWMLIDTKAFKDIIGIGCDLPDIKCDKNKYKDLLGKYLRKAEIEPLQGGIEFANEIFEIADWQILTEKDKSFNNFFHNIKSCFNRWKK